MADINKQLRQWLCILYPAENQSHNEFLAQLVHSYYKYAFIKHIGKYDEEGNVINKSHVHCIIWFDKPIRLNTLLNKFNLPVTDAHLFTGLDDLKTKSGKRQFKTIDNYIDYTTHQSNENKTDKYTIDNFVSNDMQRIRLALDKNNFTNFESFNGLISFIDDTYKDKSKQAGLWDFSTWYKYCNDMGYGDVFYKNWSKCKDILKDYISNIIN